MALKPAKKKPAKGRKPPKAAPLSKVKSDPEMDGPRPLSMFDFQFCQIFVQTGRQVDAWRQLRPDDKDPHRAAHRMMQRPEIREHIREIFGHISKDRGRAAELAARASLLTLEVADDRLMEILQQPRKTLGMMLSKDLRTPMMKGAMQETDEDGHPAGVTASTELLEKLEGAAPVEDADLLKAIDLTFKRKNGVVKADKAPDTTPLTVMLYKPKWFGGQRPAPTIEGQQ